MQIWAIRVVALALLLLLALLASLGTRTLTRLPDTVVYFVNSEDTSFTLERAYRKTASRSPDMHARAAIEALVRGPTPAERDRGLTSAMPPTLEVRSVDLQDDILHVNLSSSFETGGGTALMRARLMQLFYTLTQPGQVDGVALSVEGARVHVFSGEGILVDQPWLRRDHPDMPRW